MENSPIKQDAALIRGAGMAAKPYVDVMAPMYRGLHGGDSRMALLKYRDKLARQRRDELEMQQFVNNMSSTDVSKVEESMRPELNEYLIGRRNEYAKAARIAAKADPASREYMEAVQTMNSINSAIVSVSEQLDGFKTRREKYFEDFANNSISAYSDEARINLNNLYNKNNEYDIEFDGDTVNLMHNGEIINLSDMAGNAKYDYNLKNEVAFNEIRELTQTAYGLKQVIKDGSYLERNYRHKINNMISPMSREDLMSLVMDEGLGADVTILDNPEFQKLEEELFVPENEQLLKNWVTNHILKSIKAVSKESEELYRSDLGDEYDTYYKNKYKGYLSPAQVKKLYGTGDDSKTVKSRNKIEGGPHPDDDGRLYDVYKITYSDGSHDFEKVEVK